MKRHLIGGVIAILVIGVSATAVRSQSSSIQNTPNPSEERVVSHVMPFTRRSHDCGWKCREEQQRVQLGMLNDAYVPQVGSSF